MLETIQLLLFIALLIGAIFVLDYLVVQLPKKLTDEHVRKYGYPVIAKVVAYLNLEPNTIHMVCEDETGHQFKIDTKHDVSTLNMIPHIGQSVNMLVYGFDAVWVE